MPPERDLSVEVQLAILVAAMDRVSTDISEIKVNLRRLDDEMEARYVTRAEFLPIQKLVYGLVALVLTSVAAAVLGIVLVR